MVFMSLLFFFFNLAVSKVSAAALALAAATLSMGLLVRGSGWGYLNQEIAVPRAVCLRAYF